MNIFKDYYKNREETVKKLNLFFDFDDLSKDLDLFFCDNERGESVASKYINHILETNSQFKPDLIIQAFDKEVDTIISDVARFYFDDGTDTNIKTINEKIKNSSFPPNIKRSLYSFFINPTEICTELKRDIKIINRQVAMLYKMKENKENVYSRAIGEKTSNLNIEDNYMDTYCSYSLVFKDRIFRLSLKSKHVIIVGTNADEFSVKTKNVQLHFFGSIISDKSRIKVLEYLKSHPFSDIYSINQYVKIKITTLVYHLNLMLQARILKKHSNGKIILYEINSKYLNNFINTINDYLM